MQTRSKYTFPGWLLDALLLVYFRLVTEYTTACVFSGWLLNTLLLVYFQAGY